MAGSVNKARISSDIESELVELLATGEVCSGTAIGETLGISRVAVKKRISALIDQGMPVQAIPGKGYAVVPDRDLLSRQHIHSLLAPNILERISLLDVHQSLASTNSHLKALPPPASGHLNVILAESQPQGRGRRGRSWVTTPYRNLMLSAAWRYSQWPRNPAAISLAFGVAVHQAIADAGATSLEIKWPNDILLGGKKLGGLLVEAGGEATGACDLVFGVGINFFIDPERGKGIDQDWDQLSSQRDTDIDLSRNKMAARILSNLVESLLLFETEGFAPFANYWNANAAYVESPVRFFNENKQLSGVLKGVDESGVLILDGFDGEEHRFTQSDISLRPLDTNHDMKPDV